MNFGVATFPTHDGIGPAELARQAEERGQESLFFTDHSHVPAARTTPYPAPGEMPAKYWHTLDLFVALTAAACATSRLRIGSGICVVVHRDPIVTASEVASVDHLSGGRFEFGVGAGWNLEEMRNHGTDPSQRFALMRERIEAMKAIWTEDEASYAGRHVAFDRIWAYPKPAQRPHPPVLVGGDGPKVLDRVLSFGDAWLPVFYPQMPLRDRIAELRARADRNIDVQVMGAPSDPLVLEKLRAWGVRRAIHWLPSAGASVVERALDRWEHAIAELNGGRA